MAFTSYLTMTSVVLFLLVMTKKRILSYREMRGFVVASLVTLSALVVDAIDFESSKLIHTVALVIFAYSSVIRMRERYRHIASVIAFLLGLNTVIIYLNSNLAPMGIDHHHTSRDFYLFVSLLLSSTLMLYYLRRKERIVWERGDVWKFVIFFVVYLSLYRSTSDLGEEMTYELATTLIYVVGTFVLIALPASELLFYGVLDGVIYRRDQAEYLFVNPDVDSELYRQLMNCAEALSHFSRELLETDVKRRAQINYGNLSLVFQEISPSEELIVIYRSRLQNFEETLRRMVRSVENLPSSTEQMVELFRDVSKTNLQITKIEERGAPEYTCTSGAEGKRDNNNERTLSH